MAVNLVNGDLLQFRVQSYQSPQLGENIYHYVVAVEGTTNTLENIIGLYDAIAAPLYILALNQTATYYGTSGRRLTPLPTYEYSFFGNQNTGGGGAVGLPTQVSGIFTKVSTVGGRSGRGRAYIPFPAVTDNDTDDTPTDLYVGKVQTIGSALMGAPIVFGTTPNTITLNPVILHRTIPSTWTYVWVIRTPKAWATQRRRGNFGRTNPTPG